MIKEQLREYIRYILEIKSETEDIEVKSANKGCPKIHDTLSSFANRAGGGVIIFGIDEKKDFELVGVYDANDLQKKIVSQCNEMEPKIRPEFTILNYEGNKKILSAEIPEIAQNEKPCYYKAKGIQKGSYIRVGDADEQMTAYEIYNLNTYKKQAEDDLRAVEKANLDDLNQEELNEYLTSIKNLKPNLAKLDDTVILEKLGILKNINGELKPTISALLCFGICPEYILPQLVITAIVVPGFEIGQTGEFGERFIDNKKIVGTIPQMIKSAVEFVTRNMKKKTIIRSDNGQRDDKFEYPLGAVREAIINSLVHRDYSIYNESSYISVRMFNDRLEIINPGILYGGLTVDNIYSVTNPPVRNKNLVRILEEMGELENRSSGILTMIREMRDLRLEPPTFKNERGNFSVVFKNYNLMTKADQKWLKDLNIELTENEAYALVYLKKNFRITNGDYQKINNVNRDRALLELKGLINKDIIVSQGVGSGTFYELKEQNNESEINVIEQDNDIPCKITEQDNDIPCKITEQDNDMSSKTTEQDRKDKLDKILEFCKEARSKKEIMEFLSLSHRTNFEENYLKPLLKDGKLKMTIPKKPTSRNQKYISVI